MSDGVVWLPSFHDAIAELSDADQLQVYRAFDFYGICGEEIQLSGVAKAIFVMMKPVIDSSQNRHKASKANGSKPPKEGSNPRGRPSKNQSENQTKNQSENQRQNQDIDIDSDSDIDIDSEKDSDMTAPSRAQVYDFVKKESLSINADLFYDYNQARGWKINGESISDWKALARSWETREKKPEEKKWNIHYD